MTNQPPYIVVVTAPASGVGKSTLASNLAVYLKALSEDLPVAYASCEPELLTKMFSFGESSMTSLNDVFVGSGFPDLLNFGEFGVEYCSIKDEPVADQPAALRKIISAADYNGILVLDLPMGHPLLPTIIWAADLIFLPLKDPSTLSSLAELRRELVASGGNDQMLWVLPSELGEQGDYQGLADSLEFLRFAAQERNVQVLDETFFANTEVHEQAAAKAKPVLTRAAQGPIHHQLKQLATFVHQQFLSSESLQYRFDRCRADGLLPERAGRVGLVCPVCQQGVRQGECHYLEAIPSRKRTLLHPHCLDGLLKGSGGAAFFSASGLLVVQPGGAHGGSVSELRLLVMDAANELLHAELFDTSGSEAWHELLRAVTGRALSELYQEHLFFSAAVSVEDALSCPWYRTFVLARRGFWQRLDEEKI